MSWRNMTSEEITNRIREAVRVSGKLKKDIAKEIFVSAPTLSEYLSGKSLPSLQTFVLLCKCLDVSADELLGLDK